MAYFRPVSYPERPEAAVSPSPAASSDDVIQIEDLRKRFGRKEVVCGLTFFVPPRMLFGFLGPNGAGKSTTLYMLLGLVRPSGGAMSIFGRSVRALEVKRRVGSLIEQPAFYGYLTGRKNLELLGRLT